ncbi:MAG: lysophospholipid acyltransferase family protein [Oligoflexia bacterium]|nr:lysophospholipid acyltransferase family protein [Oligoflexia bacterium]
MYYIGIIVLKLISLFLQLLPRFIFLKIGAFLGRSLLYFGFRRDVVENNFKIVSESKEPINDINIQAFYEQFGILLIEFLSSFYKYERIIRKIVTIENVEYLNKAQAKGLGVLVMTSHMANWEILPMTGVEVLHKKVTMVTKRLKPDWFHRIVFVTRELMGIKMALEPRTMKDVLKALKNKEIVGFVMDQYAGAPVGARVHFFDKPTGSHTALANIALRTEAPVVPATVIRQKNGKFIVRFEPEIEIRNTGELENDVIYNTAQFVSHTERWVRENPNQWLWMHRRWKGDLSPLSPNSYGEMLH